ncbi:MAG: amino acid permease [Candidatus Omnitrophica bacterium]|nr:amino acid permease [Candidatus Omnitrophota bacterium]
MKTDKGLKKELTFLDVFCLATGAMISSGLFVLPGIAHAKVGPVLFLAYLLAGLLALTGLFSQAELVSAMPKSGGAYFFVTRSLGPAVGTIQGLLTWLSLILKAAFALVGMAAFIQLILPSLADSMRVVPWAAILLAVMFLFLNVMGAKKAGRAQIYLVIFLLVSLVLYIGFGLSAVQVENLVPFMPNGLESVFVLTGFIFIAYGGLLNVASVAEEVKQAERVIPRAMIASLIITTVFYSLVVFVTTGILGAERLDGSLTPLSIGAEVSMGGWGVVVMSIAAILSFITTANAGIMAASRYPLALSRDKLLPSALAVIHPKYRTPVAAIVLSGAVLILCLFLKLDLLVELASTVLILTFMLSHLSVLILRESNLQNYRPTFKSPLYPWLQIISTVIFLFILFEMSTQVFFTKFIFIIVAFFIYWFYGRLRNEQKYALLHIIERLTAKELVTGQLEDELKTIIRERDEIMKDRFDHVIEDCSVLDIPERVSADKFFEMAAQRISEQTDISRDAIELALLKREREGSTAINDEVAIPHIILDGKHEFNVVLARCRQGIDFGINHPDIYAVFILYGSKDERAFHLRALSAIAQIVSEEQFSRRWLAAKKEQALRDIILLGKRIRSVPRAKTEEDPKETETS